VFSVKYELGFLYPEDNIPHSRRRENFKSYILSDLFTPVSYSTAVYIELPLYVLSSECY
jgi:hypothetical protein